MDGGIPQDPETLHFDFPVSHVEINAGARFGGEGEQINLEAFDVADSLIDSDTITLSQIMSPLNVSGIGIVKAVVTSESNAFVLDDLSFVPDPCADDDGDGRVTICHLPPDNPGNARTITISVRALPAHLAHGDTCGPCEGDSGVLLMGGDGDTEEPTPHDLDGNQRFVDDPNTDDTGFGDPPIVDMGAYEFQFQDSCADDDGDGRVTICHIPPGNPGNAHTISVGARAVPAHLAHGDSCGPCEEDDGLLLRAGESEVCSADVNGDGAAGPFDLAILLGAWGPCEGCPTDFNADGVVNAADLAQVLGAWGMCP